MDSKPFLCKTEDLQPGMVTTDIVRSPTGQEILMSGTRLSKFLITRLVYYKVESASVYIPPEEAEKVKRPEGAMDVPEEAPEPEPPKPAPKPEETKTHITVAPMPQAAVFKNTVIEHETKTIKMTDKIVAPTQTNYSRQVTQSSAFQNFEMQFAMVLAQMTSTFPSIANEDAPINTEEALSVTKKLYKLCPTSIQLFDMLHNMRQNDDQIYAHSLNVALIARQIAVWVKLPEEEIDVVTLAGIYHDIGKIKVPEEVLTKKEKLTDEEFQLVRNHPQYGYNILKKQKVDNRIKKAALQHHERSDGNGYPLGLVEDEIEDFSFIIALADVYEAMTAKRSYRAPLSPFQCIAEFEKAGLGVYKTEYLLTFLKQIAKTYQNNRVLLSNGASANIVLLNDQKLSKPVVQLNDGSCIDLQRSDLYIQALI